MSEKIFLEIIPIILGVTMFLFGFVILFTKISLKIARVFVICFTITTIAYFVTKFLSYVTPLTTNKALAVYATAILICVIYAKKEKQKRKQKELMEFFHNCPAPTRSGKNLSEYLKKHKILFK